jgi:hypothetical protein
MQRAASPAADRQDVRRTIVSKEPVIVGTYGDSIAAHLARMCLESEGIKVSVVDENLVTLDPLITNAVGGVKLVVSGADAQAARQVLRRPESMDEQRSCPECGSTRVTLHEAGRRLAWITILLLGFPIGRARTMSSCEDCKHTWRE